MPAARRLRNAGRNNNSGGPQVKRVVGLSAAGYLFMALFGVAIVVACCSCGRCWFAYKRDGGSMSSALDTACNLLRWSFGINGAHPFRNWVCLLCLRQCCGRSRYRTMPERYLDQDENGAIEVVRLPQHFDLGSDVSPETSVVLGKEYLAAQARTVVSPFQPPCDEEDAENAITECIICLEHFEPGDPLRTLPCMHRFHKSCIDEWLTKNLSCPICKSSLRRKSKRKSRPSQRHSVT